jgi:hypothetical protein
VDAFSANTKQCIAGGTAPATCHAQQNPVLRTCVQECRLMPPPPVPPGGRPPAISPCEMACVLVYFEASGQCSQAGGDSRLCSAQNDIARDDCFMMCHTPLPGM